MVTRWTDWAWTYSESGRTLALLLAKSAAGARWVNFCVWSVWPEGVAVPAEEEPDAHRAPYLTLRCSGELTPPSLDCSLVTCSDAAPAAADAVKRRRVDPASSGDSGGNGVFFFPDWTRQLERRAPAVCAA